LQTTCFGIFLIYSVSSAAAWAVWLTPKGIPWKTGVETSP
jgi:hypothetical protein